MKKKIDREEFLKLQFETLQTANEYIVKLEAGIVELARLFKSHNEGQAAQMIPYVIDGMEWLSDAMRLTVGIHQQEIHFDEVNSNLLEIVEAFNNEDYILASDLFEYEILPVIHQWKDTIRNSIAN
ncbi:MAG: hypothetical protein E7216_10820 [Clostridium thermopalmarium]|uniref:hypothetical protein n=1 Tax=Clostridium thermopalmarium TaxID=29373 RepID=UPI0023579570|nr:hypothetical protein [Clostridium thermopalmarium]MBE6044704.1 hypothetical protein [Clostridium thermopalmarium]